MPMKKVYYQSNSEYILLNSWLSTSFLGQERALPPLSRQTIALILEI